MDLLRNITDLLGRTFPSQFVFPVLGHEDVQNSDYKDYKNFLANLSNIWKTWLPPEAVQTFRIGKIELFLGVSSKRGERGYITTYSVLSNIPAVDHDHIG